jgi:hypothetical protein
MSRRSVGGILIATAAFLYSARFFTAAIFSSNIQGWSSETFKQMMNYVGAELHIWAAVALIAGIAYLVWAELSERKNQNKK